MAAVIVTGAFGALGRAVVAHLAAAGHQVAGVDLAPAPADFAGAMAVGGVNLTDEAAVKAAYDDIAGQLGGIAALVNIAGGFVWELVEGGQLASWDRMYQMNLRTAATSASAALGHLIASGGAIVNVGANAALNPAAGMAPYTASKAGVHALTASLAEELRGRVRVNAVLPTIIDTPTNRADMPDADTSAWVKPESAAKVIAFLISADAGSIPGACLPLSLAG
ncbi:MAG TPA: SDR family NAD(P)-dependent oxidoreductase [Novosphingobium sp.]|nr:SDR family NAD(P)-dependent oxidoreductase [Novosphingobium sp.]